MTHEEAKTKWCPMARAPLYCWVMRKSDGPCAWDARLFEQRDETA